MVFKEHGIEVQRARVSYEEDTRRIENQITNSEKLQKNAEQEVQHLEEKIAQKQIELQHHQQIVAHL